MPEQPSEMDRLVLGPDAAFAEAAAPPPKVPPRHKGKIELAVGRDLRAMPTALRQSALAATALDLARDLDSADRDGMTKRDKAGHARELRMHMTDLAAQAPGERKGDSTDEVRERRERRLAAAGE
jgi:hypothetical protein